MQSIKIKSPVKLPFKFAVGDSASKFFTALAKYKTIYGSHCGVCNRVTVPARSSCSTCHSNDLNWQALPSCGTLQGWSRAADQGNSFIALVQLAGADNLFVHKLQVSDESVLVKGLAVEVMWAENPVGSLLDIGYFQPTVV